MRVEKKNYQELFRNLLHSEFSALAICASESETWGLAQLSKISLYTGVSKDLYKIKHLFPTSLEGMNAI